MFEAGFTYILSKSLMNTRTNKEKSEPNFPGRKRVRIFLVWFLFILSEAETTPSEKGGIFVFTVV